MTEPIRFTVRGLPVPQGTARAFMAGGRARIATDSNRANSPIGAWRAAIRNEAQIAMGERPLIGDAVALSVSFTLPRPQGHFGVRGLKPSAPLWVTKKPDIDKLLRALLDGMTNVVFRDDSLVCDVRMTKVYGDAPGVSVEVTW
jgi:Holliday junction resolvase RusA-like endonuclease